MQYIKERRATVSDEIFPKIMPKSESESLIVEIKTASPERRKEIRDILIKGHVRLAAAMAASFHYSDKFELFGEASYALTLCAERAILGHMKHTNFKSYARRYIHGYLCKYVKKNIEKHESFDDVTHDRIVEEPKIHAADLFDQALKVAGLDELEMKVIKCTLAGMSVEAMHSQFDYGIQYLFKKKASAENKLKVVILNTI